MLSKNINGNKYDWMPDYNFKHNGVLVYDRKLHIH